MTRSLLAALATAMLFSGGAHAERIVISSGLSSGYYHEVADRLSTVLLIEYQTTADVVASNGSLENLGHLTDPNSEVNLALVQSDALHVYSRKRPDLADELVFLTDIGRECAFIVSSAHGSIRTLADLRSKKATLAIPTEQSGARVTFAAMKHFDPALRQTTVTSLGALESLLAIKTGRIDAALFVQRPRAVPPIEIVLENQDTYRFASVPSDSLPKAKLQDDRPVYSFETVKVGFGRNFSASVETICTRGLLIGSRTKLSEASRELIARALISSGRYVLPGTR
jgi:TRAP-type uncharacterized transport system substrate-binding protein